MNAIRIHQFGEPSVLKYEAMDDPSPGAGEVVVTARAIGVNPVDTYIRAGIYGPKTFPFTPGSDAAGVVEAVGAGVVGIKRGDRVYIYGALGGCYAQKILCKAQQVHRLPEKIGFEEGAAIGVPYGTAYRALFIRGGARPGETVLVHGASGGVGSATVQFARAAGMVVIGTAGTEAGRKLVLDEGAHHVLDHTRENYLEEIASLTAGRGVDVVIEMLSNVNLGKDLGILAKRGRVVVVGSRGPVQINPRDTMGKDSDIRGMSLMHADDAELALIHAAIVAGLENQSLRPVIGKRFALRDAAQAHDAVMAPGSYGKIVLIP